MRLVEKHIITKDNLYYREVDDLCFRAKNLYNVGLYTIRQHYFKTKIFLGYENLQKQLQQNKQVDYYALPTKVSQQILRLTCKNFESFFKAWQSYKKNPGKFKAPPKLPKYKHKTKGRSLVIYPIDAINKKMLKESRVKLSMSEVVISSRQKNVQQVRIVPKAMSYTLEIIYEKSSYLFKDGDIKCKFIDQLKANSLISNYFKKKFSKTLNKQLEEYNNCKKTAKKLCKTITTKLNSLLKENLYNADAFKDVKLSKQIQKLIQQKPQSEELMYLNRLLLHKAFANGITKVPHIAQANNLDKKRIAGIDIGLNNLAAITSNHKDLRPIVINGRPLKSINQYFNKKRSKLMSFVKDKGTSNRIKKLTHKRNCKVENYLHQSTRIIVNLLLKHRIGTLIIGKNDDWKQQICIGKRNNQNFVSIPHSQFVHQLQYKAEIVGIKVFITEESYTSKCSFLDSESIRKHEHYLGKRIKRGLFQSKNGTILNADTNGSANIIRKVVPNAFANGIEGIVVFPKRITPLKGKIG